WVCVVSVCFCIFFFQAEDGIRDDLVTGVQTCALPISTPAEAVTFSVLERVARAARAVLADRTIRMRLQFWAGAIEYAQLRGVVRSEERRVGKEWRARRTGDG